MKRNLIAMLTGMMTLSISAGLVSAAEAQEGSQVTVTPFLKTVSSNWIGLKHPKAQALLKEAQGVCASNLQAIEARIAGTGIQAFGEVSGFYSQDHFLGYRCDIKIETASPDIRLTLKTTEMRTHLGRKGLDTGCAQDGQSLNPDTTIWSMVDKGLTLLQGGYCYVEYVEAVRIAPLNT